MRVDIMPEDGGHITITHADGTDKILIAFMEPPTKSKTPYAIIAITPDELTALIRGLTCFEADVPPSKQIWLDDEPGTN